MSATETADAPGRVPPGAKKLDYWWTVLFTDPIAVPLTNLLLRRSRPTANQVSVVALLIGLSVGPVFALGTRAGLIAGALLFYLAFIVDCVDGKLARARDDLTPRGAGLDKLSDGGRRAGASLGLIIYLWRAQDDASFLWAAAYAVLAYYFLEVSGESERRRTAWSVGDSTAPRATNRWTRTLARRRLLPNPGMPDVQAVVFILGPLTGLVEPAFALGIVMVTAGILMNARRRLTRA